MLRFRDFVPEDLDQDEKLHFTVKANVPVKAFLGSSNIFKGGVQMV